MAGKSTQSLVPRITSCRLARSSRRTRNLTRETSSGSDFFLTMDEDKLWAVLQEAPPPRCSSTSAFDPHPPFSKSTFPSKEPILNNNEKPPQFCKPSGEEDSDEQNCKAADFAVLYDSLSIYIYKKKSCGARMSKIETSGKFQLILLLYICNFAWTPRTCRAEL